MKSNLSVLFPLLLALICGKTFFASPWLEKFIIVMDAGSTGSRIYVYKYDEKFPLETISEVAHMRVNPALSTFVNNSAALTLQLNSLVEFAMTITPSSSWSSTSICLKATAGLRSLTDDDQKYLMDATTAVLKSSVFSCDASKTKVISGEEEALFDILAVTALFQSYKDGFISLGAADMGGSSQQIAFLFNNNISNIEPKSQWSIANSSLNTAVVEVSVDQHGENLQFETEVVNASTAHCRPDWRISIPGTNKIVEIYSKSLEYMGLIAAMDTALHHFYVDWNSPQQCSFDSDADTAIDVDLAPPDNCAIPLHPCLPEGVFVEVPGFKGYPQPLHGSGDFDKCHQLLRDYLVPQAKLTVDLECIKQRRPKVMVGMDNYPKVLEILGIPQGVSVAPSEIKRLALLACRRPWKELLADYPDFMPYRAQRACFGASYVYTMLVDVYGIEEDDQNAFLPVDTVGEHELSWALGAAVFSAMNLEVR